MSKGSVLWFSWVHERRPDGSVNYDVPTRVEHTGYNRVRNRLIAALKRAGLAVQNGGPPPPGAIQISHAPLYREPKHLSIWSRDPSVERAICYTTFESTQLPWSWIEAANTFDAVWTTSEWNRDAFLRSGVRVPVHVIHHGIEPGQYPVMDRPARRNQFVYLWQGMSPGDMRNLTLDEPEIPAGIDIDFWGERGADSGWFMRAGADPDSEAAKTARRSRMAVGDRKQAFLVREAFLRLRAAGEIGPDAKLVLKWTTVFNKKWDIANFPLDGHPTDLFGVPLDDDAMRALLYNCDVSVSPYRAEGFGMIPLEHMATGLPAIATNYSGPVDYLRQGTPDAIGIPLGYTLGPSWYSDRVRAAAGSGRPATPENLQLIADHEAQGGFGEDAHPDLRDLMDRMAWVYHDRAKVRAMAREWADIVHRDWTWERAVQQVLGFFEAMNWDDELAWVGRTREELRTSVLYQNRDRLFTAEAA